MQKTIITTHIDTGGHGYYSVSKKDIMLLGISDKISSYSGHNLSRVFLEEDEDGTLLFETAKNLGIQIERKSGYNLKFKITHNYNPKYFDWQPKINEVVLISEKPYRITSFDKSAIFVINQTGKPYRIPLTNPFKYIH